MRETGGLPSKAGLETHVAAGECYEAAALTSRPLGEILPTPKPQMSVARRRPVGVVGVISPFNFPLILSIRSVAPALALGNTVLLKPGPRTSVTGGIMIARVLEEAGLPRGVLHVLPGGADTGQALVGDPRVRLISFTGSTAAGRARPATAHAWAATPTSRRLPRRNGSRCGATCPLPVLVGCRHPGEKRTLHRQPDIILGERGRCGL